MIKELKLKNWKSFKEATLYVDPLTIIIGSNASGKSNTLDALLFLKRISSSDVGIFQAIYGDVNMPPLRGGMEWLCRKPESLFTLEVVVDGASSNQEYRYELTVQINGPRAEVFKEELTLLTHGTLSSHPKEKKLFVTRQEEGDSLGIPTYFPTGTQGPGKRFDLNRSHSILTQTKTMNLRKEIKNGTHQILSRLQGIFVFDPIPSHMRDYTPFSEELQADASNIAGVLAGFSDDRKEALEQTLTGYLKALPERDIKRVWAEPAGKFKTDAMLYCEEGWEGRTSQEVDARGMSDGTLRYLAIVTALLTRQSGSLLVIEEVDNGLHPSRAHILIGMLKTLGKQRNIDIIITTHNPAMLDAAGVRMIPFITVVHRDHSSGISKLSQLEDIKLLPKLMASGSLGKLNTEGRIESALKQKGVK